MRHARLVARAYHSLLRVNLLSEEDRTGYEMWLTRLDRTTRSCIGREFPLDGPEEE